MKLITVEQARELDRIAIEERGVPSVWLMENAAAGLVLGVGEALKDRADRRSLRCAVFVGPGNNGGDGTAAARLLKQAGFTVRIFLAGTRERMTVDHREMAHRFEALGGTVEAYDPADGDQRAFALGADIIVDALFGVGLRSPLREPAVSAVRLMNLSEAPVVSADLPSGVEADTGMILGAAVWAAVTVTFSFAKPGHFVGKGALRTGRLLVQDIGIPRDLIEAVDSPMETVETPDAVRWLPERPADGHKGTFGKNGIVGGSVGFTGAPVLASRGALRTGAGLVTILTPGEVYPIVAVKCDEAMVRPLGGSRDVLAFIKGCDALLVGPGLGRSREAEELTMLLLREFDGPLVVDADSINALERHIDVLDGRRGKVTVLTPHDGEFARLGGDVSNGKRLNVARSFAMRYGCTLVLKGHNTITACPDGRLFVNTTGNAGMAKGGSGDVLAGMILSFLGQGMPPERAAAGAVCLHGRAGDLAARELGEYGMLPSDLIERIPCAIREFLD